MIPGTPTRASVAIDKWLELLDAAGLSGVEILDGDQPLDRTDDAIMVAPADPDTPGVFCTYGRDPSLGRAEVEQIEIAIVCRSYSGDPDMAPRRARCAEMLAAIQTIIVEHQREDGVWDKCEQGPNAVWHPVYTDAGVNCFVGLSVVCTALI